MLSDEEIIRSFNTEVTVAVVSFLERRGLSLEKFDTLPDNEIKQDFINAYRTLNEALPTIEDIPVRVTKLPNTRGAVALVDNNGNCGAILINKSIFGYSKKDALAQQNLDYGVKTNNPIGATLVHEFGHAIWTTSKQTDNDTEEAILKLYIDWTKEYNAMKLPEYGRYIARVSKKPEVKLQEWWAETIAKAIVGTPDKYTNGVMKIIKTYLL